MGFNVKTWGNPINITPNDLNRLEHGIKSSHDTLNVLQEEVGAIQLKTLDLTSQINSLISNAPDVLSTLHDLNDILIDNPTILDTLKNTDGLLSKGKQTLTIRELDQVYKNLKLNTFLHLTDVRVNGESIVNGSIIDIPSPKVDKYLSSSSNNAISNSVVTKALEDVKNSLGEIVVEESDPTVPSWAKSPVKPLYKYSEILDTPIIPSKLSDLLNDEDYATNTRVTTIYNDLNNALDEKASISHRHTKLDILDFSHTHLKSDITDFAHMHSSADIPDLQGIIDTSINNLKIDITEDITELENNKADLALLNNYLPLSGGTLTGEFNAPIIKQGGKDVANIEDLSVFVKFSDFSTNATAGIVRTGAGLQVNTNGIIRTYCATTEIIDAKTDSYRPVTASLVDYAVKSGLSSNKLSWSNEEKASARNLLGIEEEMLETLTESKSYTDTKLSELIDSAPETLNTLGELAAALKSNSDIITALNNAIEAKADKTSLNNYLPLSGGVMTGDISNSSGTILGSTTSYNYVGNESKTTLIRGSNTRPNYYNGTTTNSLALYDDIREAVNFAECTTDSATSEKTITITDFKLIKGAVVHVLFTNTNIADNTTLNINGLGAKELRYQGIPVSSMNSWQADEIVEFVYDGETWQSVGSSNTTSAIMTDPKIMLPLGMIFPAAFPLTDASVHLLDGSIISQAGMYSSFASYLKSLIANGTIQECTIDEYNLELETYGQCGKFVVDNDAGTIKLPYITEFIASNNGGQALALNELDSFKIHTHAQDAHTHGVSDPGHSHTVNTGWASIWFSAGNMYTDNGVGGTYPSINDNGKKESGGTLVSPPYGTWPSAGDNGHSHGLSWNATGITLNTSQPAIQDTGSDKTQPRTIRFPYYIVLANHIEEQVTIDINQVAEDIKTTQAMINNFVGLPVGTIISAALPIYDPCVRLLDGSILSQEGVYKQFSDYLHKVQESNPDLFISNSEYLDLVSDYGECGKFVLDDENKTIKLPMIKHFIQGTLDIETVGNITPAGLPNITGKWWTGWNHPARGFHNLTTEGAFYDSYPEYDAVGRITSEDSNNGGTRGYPWFDASRSNPIYGRSTTVQPQSILYPYYIVVSTGIETEVKISTDDIIEEFNKTKELLTTTSGLPLGMIISSAVEMDTATLRLLNGDCLSQIGLYSQFYSWINNKITNNTNSVPTCTIEEYASDVGMKGQCGKFVINNTATTQTTNLRDKVIRYQGYRLNSSHGTTSASGQSVIFVPVKQEYFVTIKRTSAPTYNYLYETSTHGLSYAITNGQHYAFAEINSRDIRTETSKYLAFTIVDTDWDTFEVFIGPEMMSVDPVSIKLPTITRFIEGLSSIEDLGKGMAAGLPNITGTVGVYNENSSTITGTGAFYLDTYSQQGSNVAGDNDNPLVYFDASRSNPIYGNSTTVQPPAVKYPYYIVVSTRVEMDTAINFAEEIDNIYTANISDESVTAWRTKLGVSGSGSGGSGIASGVIIRRWE